MKNINIKGIRRILKKGKIILIPILVTTSITLTGCSNSYNSFSSSKENGLILEYSNEGLKKGDKYIYYVNGISDEFIKNSSYIDNDNEFTSYSKFCAPIEFGKYVGEENVTWNDIRNTLNSINIDLNIKKILLKGINNLEEKNFNMCLEVLNYNLKRLTIEFGDYGETLLGRFDAYTGVAIFNNSLVGTDTFEKTIMHEILGHGMTMAYTLKDGGVLCLPSIHYFTVNKDKTKLENFYSNGESLKEALAELIAVKASGKKTAPSESHYVVYLQELELFLKSTGVEDYEFASNGIKYLIDKMKESGVEDAFDYIDDFDTRMNLFETNQNFYTLCGDIDTLEVYYLLSVTDKKIKNGASEEYIMDFVDDCINSSKSVINLENTDEYNGIVWKNNVEAELINYDWIKDTTLNSIYLNNKKKTIPQY